jgi:diguanylate cyclase (GGDEF)-like protein
MKAAERLAERVRTAAIPYPLVQGGVVTCSIGVATTVPAGCDPAPLVAAADAAMYEAKRAGRNCVRRAR